MARLAPVKSFGILLLSRLCSFVANSINEIYRKSVLLVSVKDQRLHVYRLNWTDTELIRVT